MRRVAVLATGGTIATVPNLVGKATTALGAAEVAGAAGVVPNVEILQRDVLAQSSRAMTPQDMLTVASAVEEELANADVDGVVVTHGTDTLEETAYMLSLVCAPDAPIVFTGAMRRPEQPGADGPGNVAAAITAAAYSQLSRLGPVVVVGDEIHAARWVTKVHTVRPAAFASPEVGPVGIIAEGRVHLTPAISEAQTLGRPAWVTHRVELLQAAAGVDGLLVNSAAAVADGLVVAGTGGGHVPPPMADALVGAASKGTPVVLGSRVGAGPVLRSTYSGTGSETHLLTHGVLPAGRLSPVKARLRLLVALGLGLSAEDVFPLE